MKRYYKYEKILAVAILAMLMLTACSTGNLKTGTPPTGGIYGWIYQWIGLPLQNITLKTANTIGGVNGAGWAIVIITLVIRTILLPLMLNQQKKSVTQQEKIKRLQPQMNLIQKAMRRRPITTQQQLQLSTWQRELYAKNNMSLTGGMGCLALIIQMPIMIGIYDAVAFSAPLRRATFFGISLSGRSIILAIIATIFAVIQGYISMIGIPAAQKRTMQSMMLLNPLMTLFFSLSFSGSLALYWAAGNFVSIIQQLIVTFIITPREKQRVAKEMQDKPVATVVTQADIDYLFKEEKTSSESKDETEQLHQDLRKRNQGKQDKHHHQN